jgi:hypothetical protein
MEFVKLVETLDHLEPALCEFLAALQLCAVGCSPRHFLRGAHRRRTSAMSASAIVMTLCAMAAVAQSQQIGSEAPVLHGANDAQILGVRKAPPLRAHVPVATTTTTTGVAVSVTVGVRLPVGRAEEIERLVWSVANPRSVSYGKHLSRDEVRYLHSCSLPMQIKRRLNVQCAHEALRSLHRSTFHFCLLLHAIGTAWLVNSVCCWPTVVLCRNNFRTSVKKWPNDVLMVRPLFS